MSIYELVAMTMGGEGMKKNCNHKWKEIYPNVFKCEKCLCNWVKEGEIM